MKKQDYASYEDFCANYDLKAPDNFNFSYDFLDPKAEAAPNDVALVHVDDAGNRTDHTFGFFAEQSKRLADA